MHPDEPNPFLDEEQIEQFNRHLASKNVQLRCPFCGHGYGRFLFVSVPAFLSDLGTPVTWARPLVQAECTNCSHVAHFNVPLPMPGDK